MGILYLLYSIRYSITLWYGYLYYLLWILLSEAFHTNLIASHICIPLIRIMLSGTYLAGI